MSDDFTKPTVEPSVVADTAEPDFSTVLHALEAARRDEVLSASRRRRCEEFLHEQMSKTGCQILVIDDGRDTATAMVYEGGCIVTKKAAIIRTVKYRLTLDGQELGIFNNRESAEREIEIHRDDMEFPPDLEYYVITEVR